MQNPFLRANAGHLGYFDMEFGLVTPKMISACEESFVGSGVHAGSHQQGKTSHEEWHIRPQGQSWDGKTRDMCGCLQWCGLTPSNRTK